MNQDSFQSECQNALKVPECGMGFLSIGKRPQFKIELYIYVQVPLKGNTRISCLASPKNAKRIIETIEDYVSQKKQIEEKGSYDPRINNHHPLYSFSTLHITRK